MIIDNEFTHDDIIDVTAVEPEEIDEEYAAEENPKKRLPGEGVDLTKMFDEETLKRLISNTGPKAAFKRGLLPSGWRTGYTKPTLKARKAKRNRATNSGKR